MEKVGCKYSKKLVFQIFTILNEILQLDFIHFQTLEIGRTFFVTLRSDIIKILDGRIPQTKFSRFTFKAFENCRSSKTEKIVSFVCKKS